MNKQQIKQYNKYRDSLGISTPGEEYVLKHILSRDWNRTIILLDISEIKTKGGLISVKCRTYSSSYWFSVADIDSNGWREGMTQYDKERHVFGDLHHKLKY